MQNKCKKESSISQEVNASKENSYEIIIQNGILSELGKIVSTDLKIENAHIVVDKNIEALYHNELDQISRGSPLIQSERIVILGGEPSKSMDGYINLFNQLLNNNVRRKSVLIAIGGGVTTDLVGYVASNYMRGINYINVPTSLMGQVDASVGGKVAINHPTAKNLIGAFWHPIAVYIDPLFLRSLPYDELRNGLAEVVKVSIIDHGELFDEIHKEFLQNNYNAEFLFYLVKEAVRIKCDLLATDPYERNLQRALNLGHTIGHPIEVMFNHQIPHGNAVAIGIAVATIISLNRNICSRLRGNKILEALKACLPRYYPEIDPGVLWMHFDKIKLIRNQDLHFVLPSKEKGVEFINDLSFEELCIAINSAQKYYS